MTALISGSFNKDSDTEEENNVAAIIKPWLGGHGKGMSKDTK